MFFFSASEPILLIPLGAFSLTAMFSGGLPTMSYIHNATSCTFIQCSISTKKKKKKKKASMQCCKELKS